MSVKLFCCLCVAPCLNEYKYLQNDLGECNEAYEITVKYFDPMLLTEHISVVSSKESCVLCQNCWSNIKTFHDFQQTVIKGKNSLNQLSIQNSSLEIKAQISSPLKENFDDVHNEELQHLNTVLITNNLDAKTQIEKNCDEDNDKSRKVSRSLRSCNEIFTEISNGETNFLDETEKNSRSKLRKRKVSSKESNNLQSDDGDSCDSRIIRRKNRPFENKIKRSDSHPALDKGREYDKFIAEWKSQLECDICNEVFPIFDMLKVHFKNKHNARGFVKCCDRKFDRRCSLVEHIRLHINPEMHKCDICGKLSGSKYSLIHHKKTIHEESQQFKCSKCPKAFKQKQNLKCHLLTHVTGNKDFKCQECDKAYVLELQLKKHIKLVHVDNRVCDQCGKTLHGIGALKNHLKEHDGIEKPKYPCDECGAELGSRITLKRHKASYHNDGTTVYVCGICGKVSSTERALKNHKSYVHEIERKFKCPNCDKAFKRSQNLQEHIATHTGEALYQCSQCPRSFKINSKYHEHRKKAHPIEWEESRKNRLEKQKIDYERVTNQVVL